MVLPKLLRNLMAITIAFSVMFINFTQPVLAASTITDTVRDQVNLTINQGDGGTITFGGPGNQTSNNPLSNFLDGALQTAEVMVGGVALCYAVDGLATTVFPPAVALAAFCPALPTFAGGVTATKTVIEVAKAL